MARSPCQNRVPQSRVRRLFGRSKEEDAVWSEELVNAGHQCATRVLREVEHDVAQKDDIETLVKWQGRLAKIRLAEVAELANLGFGNPIFAHVVEVANNVARGKTAVHLDAVIKAAAGAFDDFVANVGSLNMNVPPGQRRKILPKKHGQ